MLPAQVPPPASGCGRRRVARRRGWTRGGGTAGRRRRSSTGTASASPRPAVVGARVGGAEVLRSPGGRPKDDGVAFCFRSAGFALSGVRRRLVLLALTSPGRPSCRGRAGGCGLGGGWWRWARRIRRRHCPSWRRSCCCRCGVRPTLVQLGVRVSCCWVCSRGRRPSSVRRVLIFVTGRGAVPRLVAGGVGIVDGAAGAGKRYRAS